MSVAPEPSDSSDEGLHRPLVSAGNSDRCPVCGAHLAVDQRYCVECGTRRGAPRFHLAGPTAAQAAAASAPFPTAGGSSRFRRVTSNSALLIGLLIILVALGVGVLIGHNGNGPKTAAQPKVTVNLNGGSSAGTSGTAASSSGTAASTGSSASSGSTSSGSTSSGASSKSTKSTKSTKASSAASKTAAKQAAQSATTANASASGKAGTAAAAQSFSKTATKKSTVGGSCTAGTAGCQNGKQTGNLF